MSLLDQIRKDVATISAGEFSDDVEIISTLGESVSVKALPNKIGRKIDTPTGTVVNSKNASVVVAESNLLEKGFSVRNSVQEVSMIGFLVNVKDSTGVVKNYIVQETIPDESVGLITLLLGDYEND